MSNTMTTMNEPVKDTLKGSPPELSVDEHNVDQPTAFISKLFQMIGGAPNEVIAWTPDGDAFVIGPDLERLEGETLPQYFRHNRFQSFVRQLNFYSFRKINKERSVWVYKHDLFKRDHPEGLALLRRRTSSPLDGRKQRVPRPLTKKVSLQQRDETKSDDDTTTSIEAAATLQPVALCVKKRQATTTLEANFAPNHQEIITGKKRKVTTVAKQCSEQHVAQRSAWSSPDHTVDEECVTDAIATVLQAAPLTVSEDSDDQDSSSKMHNAETEMEEQSMTVSEVATQLAQYARKATIGRRGASFRRSGIVTPPSRSSRPFSLSTGNLLTYDDESGDEGDIYKTSSQVSRQKLGIDPQSHVRARHNDPEIADPDFVISRSAADGFVERVLDSIAVHDRDGLSLATKVASFCMITFPFNNTSLRNGIRELLRSCDRLAAEFQHYRLALYPSKENVVKLEQVWEHEGSRSDADATHEFRIFAVNSMQKLLSTVYMPDFRLSEGDLATLERTANMWQKSVGMTT